MDATVVYVLLSPTFGMHQYTADLARQAAALGCAAHVVTTAALPRERYGAEVVLHTPVAHGTTGFGREGAAAGGLGRVWRQITALRPDVVHVTGAHLWNPLLLAMVRGAGIPTVHTLHDLDPHPDVRRGALIRLWNALVTAASDRLLVHAERYRRRLEGAGAAAGRLFAWPLLHGCLDAAGERRLEAAPPTRRWEPWLLFLGRLEAYKGVAVLLDAVARRRGASAPTLVLAGRGELPADARRPAGAIHLAGHAGDALAWDLLSRCRALVLPYTGATQSALPAAAYAFGKPVVVSDSGALAESVVAGVTGWVTPAGDVDALARTLAMVQAADPLALAAMGDAGRAWRAEKRACERVEIARLYARGESRGEGRGARGDAGWLSCAPVDVVGGGG